MYYTRDSRHLTINVSNVNCSLNCFARAILYAFLFCVFLSQIFKQRTVCNIFTNFKFYDSVLGWLQYLTLHCNCISSFVAVIEPNLISQMPCIMYNVQFCKFCRLRQHFLQNGLLKIRILQAEDTPVSVLAPRTRVFFVVLRRI